MLEKNACLYEQLHEAQQVRDLIIKTIIPYQKMASGLSISNENVPEEKVSYALEAQLIKQFSVKKSASK